MIMENASELSTPTTPAITPDEQRLLALAQDIADTVLEPNAEAIDLAGELPVANLDTLAKAGLAGVTTPGEWGGSGGGGTFLREYTEVLTAACGTTWFVLTQHLGSCSQLATSQNPSLRERFLREAAAGNHYIGVGFGHLRRPEPMLRAEPVSGGYVLNGVAPWVTGWPILKGVIFGAVMPDGEQHVYLYADTTESDSLLSSPPLPLCAMNASATTEVRLTNHFLPEENFVRFSSRKAMAEGDERGIAGAATPPLGCARGALKNLQAVAKKRSSLVALQEAADAFASEIDACRTEARHISDGPKDTPDYKTNALRVRAWAFELSVRVAYAAVAASSGGANSRLHPAQRRFREAMFYTLIAQTGDILTATVERLARK